MSGLPCTGSACPQEFGVHGFYDSTGQGTKLFNDFGTIIQGVDIKKSLTCQVALPYSSSAKGSSDQIICSEKGHTCLYRKPTLQEN